MNGIVKQGAWGACGFVSVLNALHGQGKLTEFGAELSLAQINERLGAELITYLKMTSVQRPKIAAEILAYTKTFGPPYSGYTSINDICIRIATEVRSNTLPTDPGAKQAGIGIAMPVSGVQDYVTFAGLKSTLKTVFNPPFVRTELLKHKDCIVGCGRGDKTVPGGGLKHWVYVNPNGVLLNWGSKTDLKSASPVLPFEYIPCVVQLG